MRPEIMAQFDPSSHHMNVTYYSIILHPYAY